MLVPIVFICLATLANGKLCEHNHYWSLILERCDTCSRCVYPDIVIRPCQDYTDTVCGPLSELNIDWTWLKNQGSHSGSHHSKQDHLEKKMLDTFKENFDEIRQHEEHVKEKQRYLKRKHNREDSDEDSGEIESGDIFVGDRYRFKKNDKDKHIWEKLKLLNKHRNPERGNSEESVSGVGERNHLDDDSTKSLKTWQKLLRARSDGLHFDYKEALNLLKSSRKSTDDRNQKKVNETATTPGYDPNHLKFDENGILIKNFEFTKVEDSVKMEKLVDDLSMTDDFSTTEKFILDWQTVILGIAVSSCVVFFLVAAIYSVQHAKHWKKVINYFDTDVEELQSWITSKNPEKKIPSSGIYKTTTEVVHNEGSQCKYLERIIRMNGKNRFNFVNSNVYEKDNKRASELKPLTKKYPTVHKKTGDRI